MKNHGATFEYEEERNKELIQALHRAYDECSFIRMSEIYKRIVEMPASRFWVSEERAAIVIARMMKGDKLEGMGRMKREMFQEIYRRVMELKGKNPTMSTYHLVFKVVRQPAPKFYLTAGSAKVIISKIKRQWYEKRKKHLRHRYG